MEKYAIRSLPHLLLQPSRNESCAKRYAQLATLILQRESDRLVALPCYALPCRAMLQQFQLLCPRIQGSQPDSVRERLRLQVIEEILSSEKDYVLDLGWIIEVCSTSKGKRERERERERERRLALYDAC